MEMAAECFAMAEKLGRQAESHKSEETRATLRAAAASWRKMGEQLKAGENVTFPLALKSSGEPAPPTTAKPASAPTIRLRPKRSQSRTTRILYG